MMGMARVGLFGTLYDAATLLNAKLGQDDLRRKLVKRRDTTPRSWLARPYRQLNALVKTPEDGDWCGEAGCPLELRSCREGQAQ